MWAVSRVAHLAARARVCFGPARARTTRARWRACVGVVGVQARASILPRGGWRVDGHTHPQSRSHGIWLPDVGRDAGHRKVPIVGERGPTQNAPDCFTTLPLVFSMKQALIT